MIENDFSAHNKIKELYSNTVTKSIIPLSHVFNVLPPFPLGVSTPHLGGILSVNTDSREQYDNYTLLIGFNQ